MLPRTEARFAVGSRVSPLSTIWKMWVQGDELYLASRLFGKYQKVSLHSSGTNQWSSTDDWVKEQPGRRNADRHIVRWQSPPSHAGQALLVFKIQIPFSELRPLPAPTDKKKVFWIANVPPDSTLRFLFYITDVDTEDPAPLDSEARRKLFSLRFRSGRWLVALFDLPSLSQVDLSNARKAVVEQFWPTESRIGLSEARAVLFGHPSDLAGDCHGFIEIALPEG